MRKQTYFPIEDGPQPLVRSVMRAVRFEETDPLGVVWHGRYASYFEDARVMLGDSIGLGYFNCHAAGLMLPVTHMSVDYKIPMRYGDTVCVTAALHYTQAARLCIAYTIRHDKKLLSSGCTVQHFTTLNGELCLGRPDFYEAFCTRWMAGEIPTELPPFDTLSPLKGPTV